MSLVVSPSRFDVAAAGIALGNHSITQFTSSTLINASAISVSAGSHLSVFLAGASLSLSTAPTVSDGGGNTYTALQHATANQAGWLFDAPIASANASLVVTASWSGGATGAIYLVEVQNTSGVDKSAVANTYGNSVTATTAATTHALDLVIAYGTSNDNSNPSQLAITAGGYTALDHETRTGITESSLNVYKLVSATGAQSVTVNNSGGYKISAFVVAYY